MPPTPKRTSRRRPTALAAAVRAELEASIAVKRQVLQDHVEALALGVKLWHDTLRAGGKILLCGNGGSAADCQHIATELVVRLQRKRCALPGLALTTDTSILTAAGNDFGFERIFARQVEALGQPGDLLVAISTSGRSPNVLAAAAAAKKSGLRVLALTGRAPNTLARRADLALSVPSRDTQRIQEAHITLLHILVGQTERLLLK